MPHTKKIVVSLLAVFAISTWAYGRAGGGQNYQESSSSRRSSSSFYSTSGSSRSGGGGGLGFGSIIFLGVVGFLAYRSIKSETFRKRLFSMVSVGKNGISLNSNVSNLFVDEVQKVIAQKTGKDIKSVLMDTVKFNHTFVVAKLHESDPAFDEQAFLARCRDAFVRIQKGWSEARLNQIRPFVTDGVHDRFSIQLELMKQSKRQNRIENVKVMSAVLSSVENEGAYTRLTVELRAIGNDVTTDLEGNTLNVEDGAFNEYWTFLRKTGTQTQTGKAGLMECMCPVCSAPLDVVQNAKCDACGSLVRSGSYDWVLSEISQTSDSVTSRLNRLVASNIYNLDKDFSTQIVEDSASVMFWRCVQARMHGDSKYLLKCASPEYVQRFDAAKDPKNFVDTAIGSSEVISIQNDETTKETHCQVQIKWSTRYSVGGPVTSKVSTLLLKRKFGATSEGSLGYGANHCHGCGAPDDGGAQPSCAYCGHVFNDGSKEWVLHAVT